MFLKNKGDDTIADPDNLRMKTSCAVTQPVDANQPTAWWTASFEQGPLEIMEVEVWGEHYKTIWDRAMFGVQVFIDDQLCGEITPYSFSEPYKSFKKIKEGNGYHVTCAKPITGSSVRIETKRAPKETDLYKSGLTLCDIRVFTTEREPIYNGFFKVGNDGTRDFEKYPIRADWDLPLG